MIFSLPNNVLKIIESLNRNNYECFVVGGCVRDMLLGNPPKDYDLTTNAKPNEILEVFKDYKTFDAGIKHGTISVVIDNEVFEITTYRIDGDYLDSRHPENVVFTDAIEKDLSRRDFTVNAMAYSPQTGLVDYYGGVDDIKYKAIRCVGEPDIRFREDALRILRALRFASVYNFSIEFNTYNAIMNNKNLLNNISKERISSELTKIICGESCDYILRRFKEVFAVVIPEISSMFHFEQNNPHHNKTLWKHTVSSVKNIDNDEVLRMTMLLHDIGKPLAEKMDKKGVSHYNGHEKISSTMSERILKRLRFSNSFINQVVLLIKYHDVGISTDKFSIKKMLNIMGKENFSLLLKVRYADIMAQSYYQREEKLSEYNQVKELFNEIISNKECYQISDVAVNGKTLLENGITDGKAIGEKLDYLLNLVMREECKNTEEELLKFI